MKTINTLLLGGALVGFAAFANTANNAKMPAESNTQAEVESDVDVDKNIFTGSKTVTTTKKYKSDAEPGVKNKRFSKNVKKYDKDGNLIKNESETENSAEQNK